MAEIGPGSTRGRGVILVTAIFILGLVCGAALFYLGQRSLGPPGRIVGPPPPAPLDDMTRELGLDPDQRREIRTLLDEQRVRLHELLEASRREIRAVLRPDQQQRFDDLRPPRPGPPGPPGPPPPGSPRPGGHPPPPPG
jgi:hypothetical protein